MTNLKQLKAKFASLIGAKFININGYIAKGSGEVANHNVIANISIMNAKKSDLDFVENFENSKLLEIANLIGTTIEVAKIALQELVISGTKNVSNEITVRTLASQSQTSAYASLGNGLRLHLDTMQVSIFAFKNTKKVLVEGVHKDKKAVKSSHKTLVKNEIRKSFKMTKSREFILGHIDDISINGTTITL